MAQEATEAPIEGQEPTSEPDKGQEPTKAESPLASLPAETQAEIKTLRAEAAKHRKDAQEARAKAQEYEDRDKSELEKLTGKLTKAEQAKAEAEARLLRFEVANEKDVPAKLVPLLTAATKEDLEAQADLILENAKTEPPPDFDGGAREPAPDPKTPEQAHNDFALAALGIARQT